MFSVLNCVAEQDRSALEQTLTSDMHRIVRLHGRAVQDTASFLAQAAVDFPNTWNLRPHNWTAFEDILWNLFQQDVTEGEDIAFIWTHADKMSRHNMQDFLIAADLLVSLARKLLSGGSPSVNLRIFLLGDTPEYPRL
jgi:hypothetical protein